MVECVIFFFLLWNAGCYHLAKSAEAECYEKKNLFSYLFHPVVLFLLTLEFSLELSANSYEQLSTGELWILGLSLHVLFGQRMIIKAEIFFFSLASQPMFLFGALAAEYVNNNNFLIH